MNAVKKSGLVASSVLLIAAPFTASYEGLRLQAYLDPVGVPTICHGETKDVELGQVKTKEECDAMFAARLGWFSYMVSTMIDYPMPDKTHAAFTSFSYNIGVNGFRKSRARALYNAGQFEEACDAMMGWYRAGGRDCRVRSNNCYGLIVRRKAEVKLCKEGFQGEEI